MPARPSSRRSKTIFGPAVLSSSEASSGNPHIHIHIHISDPSIRNVGGHLLGEQVPVDSPNARDRVRAVHSLATGVETLERQVLFDAQASGMTWAEIGGVYGVSRHLTGATARPLAARRRAHADERVSSPPSRPSG